MWIRQAMAIAAIAFVGVTMAPGAQAQVEFEVSPFGGGTLFLAQPPDQFMLHTGPDRGDIVTGGSFEDTWHLGVNAGLRINEVWAVEGMFSWLPTKLSATRGLSGPEEVDGYMYGITGLYYIPISANLQPFVGLGVGGDTFDYRTAGIETHTHFMGNAVVGLYAPLTDMTGIRFEARDCIARFDSGVVSVDDKWENDLMLSMGVSFRTPLGR